MGEQLRLNDYRLNGRDTARAIEQGLANAAWYMSPVPKEQMRLLLERRDGPAVRDTLLWFFLLLIFGAAGYLLRGTWWAVAPFAVMVCSTPPSPIPAGTNRSTALPSERTG